MRQVAGSRRPREEVLHIDYADVLAQAVRNERHEVIRLILENVGRVPTRDNRRGDSWNHPERSADAVVRDIKDAIQRVAEAP